MVSTEHSMVCNCIQGRSRGGHDGINAADQYVRSVTTTSRVDRLSNQIQDKMGKWRGVRRLYKVVQFPPFAPQGLRLKYLLSTCLYTLYINRHHGLLRRRPRVHSELQ